MRMEARGRQIDLRFFFFFDIEPAAVERCEHAEGTAVVLGQLPRRDQYVVMIDMRGNVQAAADPIIALNRKGRVVEIEVKRGGVALGSDARENFMRQPGCNQQT